MIYKVKKPSPNYTELHTPVVNLYFSKDKKTFRFGIVDWEIKWFNILAFGFLISFAVALILQ